MQLHCKAGDAAQTNVRRVLHILHKTKHQWMNLWLEKTNTAAKKTTG